MYTRTRVIDVGPDDVAIARCKAGDADAFAELVDRYQGMVAGLVSRTLRDPEDTADVTMEVFVRAFRSLKGFRADSRFSTWLYRIALNTAMRHAGKAARERRFRVEPDPEKPDLLSMLPADPEEGPEAQVWKQMSCDSVRSAVCALPDKQRAVIVLHYFDNRTCEEISEILGVSIGTVWSRIHYAVKRLRQTLAQDAV